MGYVFHFGATMIILFGSVHLYRVNYIVSTLLVLLALHQLFAPNRVTIPPLNVNKEDKNKIPCMTRLDEGVRSSDDEEFPSQTPKGVDSLMTSSQSSLDSSVSDGS